MLEKVTAANPAVPSASEDKYKVGDYAVYPGLGLSVISARKAMDIGGLSISTLEIRPLHDLKTSVSIPEMKVKTSGLRRPANASQFKEALELVAGKAKGEGQRWHTRAQRYEERMKTGDLFEIASIIRDVAGKYRHKKFTNIQTEDVPVDAAVSYSERILVLESLNLLSREMTMVTGISMTEASRLFMAAALDPSVNFNDRVFVDKGEMSMSGKKFQEIFGHSIREASKGDGSSISVIVPTAQAVSPRRHVSSIDMEVASKPRMSRVNVGSRARSSVTSSNLDEVKPELQDLYAQYYPQCAVYGYRGAALKLATQYCSVPDFDLLCQMLFIKNDIRPSPQTIAEKMEITVDEVWKRAEQAFDRLKKRGDAVQSKAFLYVKLSARTDNNGKEVVREGFADTLKDDVRKIYDGELPVAAPYGKSKNLFRKAALLLSAEQFEVLSKTALRQKDKLMTIEAFAKEKEITIEAAIKLRNDAAAALKNVADVTFPHPALRDYATGVVERSAVRVSENLREIFEAESAFSPAKGLGRRFAITAANVLSIEEFEVLSKMALRDKDKILTLDEMAAEKGISREEVRAIRNQASARLRKEFAGASPRILQYKQLHDHFEPVVKASRVDLPPIDMKMAGEIIDGKFRIVLEMPLENLNGVDTFRVEGTISKHAGVPVSIEASGKVGKGRGGYFKTAGTVGAPPKLEK